MKRIVIKPIPKGYSIKVQRRFLWMYWTIDGYDQTGSDEAEVGFKTNKLLICFMRQYNILYCVTV